MPGSQTAICTMQRCSRAAPGPEFFTYHTDGRRSFPVNYAFNFATTPAGKLLVLRTQTASYFLSGAGEEEASACDLGVLYKHRWYGGERAMVR